MQKEELKELIRSYRMTEIVEAGVKDRSLTRMLISLVYDKADVTSWRAIEAIGLIAGETARKNMDQIRNLSQRFLWMLREESGNGPGSAPELLGEIVRNSPDAFADIAQVLTSFHDEKMLRPGVMRALWRIIDKRPDLITITPDILNNRLYLDDEDARVAVYAMMIAGRLRFRELLPCIEGRRSDGGSATIYLDGEFVKLPVSEVAEKTISELAVKED